MERFLISSKEKKDDNCACSSGSQKLVYNQKARKAWLNAPHLKTWLVLQEDASHVSCKFCKGEIMAKLSVIKAHAKSEKHQRKSTICTERRIDVSYFRRSDSTSKAEARLALYVSVHSSINPVDHLVNCHKENFKTSEIASNISLCRTKCTAIIKNVWGPHFQKNLKIDIGTGVFSLIIDESTDISIIKYLGIVIKYFSQSSLKIVVTFLDLVELVECDADSIIKSIKTTLDKFNLNLKNLSGIGTDNASVMVGINNGVFQKLKRENNCLILIPCVCHSLHLAVRASAVEHLPPEIEFMLNETYNWFSKSSQRKILYKNLYKAINANQDPIKIVRQCATRWMSIVKSLDVIIKQWLELETHFNIVAEIEKCHTARLLKEYYSNKSIYLHCILLKNILKDVDRVNNIFQLKNADFTKVFMTLTHLLKTLTCMIATIDTIEHLDILYLDLDKYMLPHPYFGFEFESMCKKFVDEGQITNHEELIVRTNGIAFLKTLIQQLRLRLPKNIRVLEKIDSFSVEKSLNKIRSPIIPILSEFNYSLSQLDEIENQWEHLTLVDWTLTETINAVEFWIQVRNYKDACNSNPYAELSDFVLSLLVLPISNADVERLFSSMNLIKNKLRNKMKLTLLTSILHIQEGLKREEKCCFNYDIPHILSNQIKSSKKYDKTMDESDDDDL